jgi:hypothetical protein
MVTYQAVSDAVDAALTNDGKAPDDTQVMQSAPYGFDNTYLMRDFLLDVSHELNKGGVDLNVDDLNVAGLMSRTVAQVKQAIFAELTT